MDLALFITAAEIPETSGATSRVDPFDFRPREVVQIFL
jgi:hypothetical protein